MSAKTEIAKQVANALSQMGAQNSQAIIERPELSEHGDFSTNIAMTLAKQLKKPPRAIAEEIISKLDKSMFDKVEAVGPGFINMFLTPKALLSFVLEAYGDHNFGKWDIGKNERVQVEFVSANPTGPITVANGRGGPLGDSLARLLSWIGYDAFREFYVNDRGAKVTHLAKSLEARYRQALGLPWELPQEGYPGEYLLDIAKDMAIEFEADPLSFDEPKRLEFFGKQAVARIVDGQKQVFKKFGIVFDKWFSEREMAERGEIGSALGKLDAKGVLYQHEGATFMRSTDFGDDKDFVVVKSTGEPTYTATDVAYHLGKFERGFSRVIDVMGADHHGHTGPMFAALKALGIDQAKLEFLLYQLVHLFRGGQLVKMSKSSGEFVTLDELLDEVGPDSARYFFLMRSSDTSLNFDIDLAKSQSMDNPVYYVQYAHVRCCSMMDDERAKMANISQAAELDHPLEAKLAKELIDFPDEVRAAALSRAPHRMTAYAERVAQAFHTFYHECKVLQEESAVRDRRMLLVALTRKVLKGTLEILGVSAPERM